VESSLRPTSEPREDSDGSPSAGDSATVAAAAPPALVVCHLTHDQLLLLS
jgi:hypothetical protein